MQQFPQAIVTEQAKKKSKMTFGLVVLSLMAMICNLLMFALSALPFGCHIFNARKFNKEIVNEYLYNGDLSFYEFIANKLSGNHLLITHAVYILGMMLCLSISLEFIKKKSFGKSVIVLTLILAMLGNEIVNLLLNAYSKLM